MKKVDVRHIFACCLLTALCTTARAQMVINELMQSNVDCLMDDLNQFPDSWVELYNPDATAATLSQYKIGVTDNPDEAWPLPSETVASRKHVLIYCDKEAKGRHTDFRLEHGKGGAVYLFKDNAVVDCITDIPKQPSPNVSLGRKGDGNSEWGYLYYTSPGSGNAPILTQGVLGNPIFSHEGGVRTSGNISLTISVPEDSPAGTEIRYTINGSEPTISSTLYKSPIIISGNSIIRARLFCSGYTSPRSVTHSYITHPRAVTLPVVSICTDNKYLYDSKIGIYVDGAYGSNKKNYEYDWRRPINIELFESEGTPSVINQLCETRVQGGASRGSMLKSLAVYANKRFGEKRFDYEFFPDQRPGMTDYKSIILRNAGNDFDYLYMRDAVIQRTMASNCDLDWQAWRPAIVYINGVYKGILNIRERSNADNIFTNYEHLEDIDLIENWTDLKDGDWTNYNAFKTFYTEHDHTMAEYEQWMDCEEYINLMVMNLFYNNQDFPGNNFVMWRPRTEDGRWRFIAKDTDFGLGLYGSSASYNSIAWIYNPSYDSDRSWANQYDHTRLFRRLMDDADFSREFIDHAAVYMGDFMNTSGTRKYWDPMYEMIKDEYPHHRKLINQWWPNYNSELSTARSWLASRTEQFYKHLADYYKLGTPLRMVFNQASSDSDLEEVQFVFNGVRLTSGKFDGKFFAGRHIDIQSVPVGSRQVESWKLKITNGTSTNVIQIDGQSLSYTMPQSGLLSIEAQFADRTDDIDQIATTRTWTYHKYTDHIVLSGVTSGTPVTAYTVGGAKIYQQAAGMGDISIPVPQGTHVILRVGSESVKL